MWVMLPHARTLSRCIEIWQIENNSKNTSGNILPSDHNENTIYIVNTFETYRSQIKLLAAQKR